MIGHFFTRKLGYATTFANLVTHRGRSELALQHSTRLPTLKETLDISPGSELEKPRARLHRRRHSGRRT